MALPEPNPKIVIVGAGFGGLGFGIWLKRHWAFEDFVIFEKASEIGGTWRDNTYPGCSSDVPIHWYSLSTDLKPDWKASYGYQPEIQDYMLDLTTKYDLRSHCIFNTRVVSAKWDDLSQTYHIVTENVQTGAKKEITAKILISATGILSEPYTPALKGAQTFGGTAFHSAKWRHDIQLQGKRVAVIGNGCSATQFVPLIAKDPSTTIVQFRRTAMWYVQQTKPLYSEVAKWIFATVPFAMRLHRYMIAIQFEVNYLFMRFYSGILGNHLRKATAKYVKATAPPEYHDLLIPSFPLGCKRFIIDTGYLAALHQPNLTLTADPIEQVTERGIVTNKGENSISAGGNIPFDVIIYATGFVADRFPFEIQGSSGQTMNEYWQSHGGPTAYLGTTVPGFPNFFMIQGPNTSTGHASVLFTEEVQFDYALQLFKPVISGEISSLEPKQAAATAYNVFLQRRLKTSVWSQCASWYRNGPNGKIHSVFPGPVVWYWWLMRQPRWADYLTTQGDKTRPMSRRGRSFTLLMIFAAATMLGVARRVSFGTGPQGLPWQSLFARTKQLVEQVKHLRI